MHDSMQAEGTSPSEEERIVANRAAIFAVLRDEGVLRAAVSYTGSGDSGGPEGVRFEMPDGPRELDEMPSAPQYVVSSQYFNGAWQNTTSLTDRLLDDALTDFAMDAVEQHFGGWEDGDGASGEVVFDATAATVVIEHNSYFTDSEYSEIRL
jgi:hypothetical protein